MRERASFRLKKMEDTDQVLQIKTLLHALYNVRIGALLDVFKHKHIFLLLGLQYFRLSVLSAQKCYLDL